MANWKAMLEIELLKHGETWDDVEDNTMSEKEMGWYFDPSYGTEEGVPFTVWTKNRVYFPVCYDGSEWVESVSRHPDGKPTRHIGG